MNHAIILAGGTGTRFWPLSRQSEPKQFLNLYSGKPMFEQTIRRIGPFINNDNIYVATNKIYHEKIKYCLERLGIRKQNVLFELEAKNTLAPIGLLSKNIYAKDKDAVIVVLPCDHYVKNKSRFLEMLKEAINVASKGYIVTLGIKPTYPETGYGYIRINHKSQIPNLVAYKVDRFIEKPLLAKAKRFIKSKSYYWNGGIFIFRAQTLLEEIKKITPSQYCIIAKINDKKDLSRLWPKFDTISIDYSIMQKSKRLALVPLDSGWVDLGSWQSIEYLMPKDKKGNIFKGRCIDIGSSNTFVWSDNRLLATVGLNNIIIVNTKDAILVCEKNKTQEVKNVVRVLKQRNLKEQI